MFGGVDVFIVEVELIEYGMKWSFVKMYEKIFLKGVGLLLNWCLVIEYLMRFGEEMFDDGVFFMVILMILDFKGE